MSAYIVNVDHIDYLVTALGKIGALTHSTLHVELRGDLRGADQVSPEAIKTSGYGPVWWEPAYDTDVMGRMLLAENIAAVSFRYQGAEDLPGPVPTPEADAYRHTPVPWDLITPAGVVQAVRCWRYQTCEDPDAQSSLAWQVMDALCDAAVQAMVREADPGTWNWARPAKLSA